MRLATLFIPVPPAASAAPRMPAVHAHRPRQLLALLATPDAAPTDQALDARFDHVLVYLHGFPDLAVHPARVDFASRLPRKLAESFLQHRHAALDHRHGHQQEQQEQQRHVAFVTFNFGGVPGSDADALRFRDKTLGQEVEDAAAVCRYARARWLGGESHGRLHVVGLSTGAIVAALLRSERALCDSVTAVAGLLDVARGVQLDFSPRQRAQCDAWGYCWKEFYLPEGCALPPRAELSCDGETRASQDELGGALARQGATKLFMRLDKRYLTECLDGSIDVRSAVAGDASASPSAQLPPLLVVHGDSDRNVPIACGQALFVAAAAPKTFVAIPKANHLLTSSKHLKLALRAIHAHIGAV